MPASPASSTSSRVPLTASSQYSSSTSSSRARPTSACRPSAAASGAGQATAVIFSTPGAGRAAGASPRSSRSCTAIAAGPGVVPSSSRSRTRSSSKTRSASAGLPAASWTSISSRCEDSRNGIAATAPRAACSAVPSSRPPWCRPASASTSSARTRTVSSSRRHSATHGPSQSGRKVWRSVARTSRAAAAAASHSCVSIAASASAAADAAISTSTSIGPGGIRRSSERPASAPSPSARRSLESRALSALSAAAGGCSGHSRSISSARPQSRSRLSTRYANRSRPCLPGRAAARD